MTMTADTGRARAAFIDSRRSLVEAAETVGEARRRGTLSAAALDRLVADVETYQNARRAFIILEPT